jgi:anti-sigma factor RsiW
MADACRDRQGDLAALALGRLVVEDEARVQAHLDGCDSCRRALAELRRTVRALPAADLTRLDTEPVPPADLPARIASEVRRARHAARRRRRNRALVGIAAAAAVVVVAIGTVALARGGSPTMHDFATEAPGVDGEYAIQANDQGTAVRLAYRGLHPDDVYWLWLTDGSGRRVSAGTFRGTEAESTVVLQSALPAERAVRIWVTDATDAVLLDSPVDPD